MKNALLPLVFAFTLLGSTPGTRVIAAGGAAGSQLPYPPGPPVLPPDALVVTIEATVPDAYETGGIKGFFTVRRAVQGSGDIAAAPALTVSYQVGGTAIGGSQYRALPGFVVIPAGQSEAQVKVKPLDDGAAGSDATVKLTLLPGEDYGVGSPAKAKVRVHEPR